MNKEKIKHKRDESKIIASRTQKPKEEDFNLSNFLIWLKENKIKKNKDKITKTKDEKEQLILVKINTELEEDIEVLKQFGVDTLVKIYNESKGDKNE